MQVSNQGGLTRQEQLSDNLLKIQTVLQLDSDQYYNFSGITKEHLSDTTKLPFTALELFTKKINISIDSLMSSNIDLDIIRRNFSGDSFTLPDRFNSFSTSRNAAVANLLEYLRNSYPRHYDSIVRRLQITPELFDDPTAQVGVNLINDIYTMMQEYRFHKNVVQDIGRQSIHRFSKETDFFNNLPAECSSLQKLCEYFITTTLKDIDKTWDYSLVSSTTNRCVIHASTKNSTQDFFRVKHYGCENICHHRLGVLEAVSSLINVHPPIIRETKCIHDGNDYCQYEIDYN